MPKMKFRENRQSEEKTKVDITRFYETKFYSIFLNSYEFSGLDQEQSHYLLKRLWKDGTIACFIAEGTRKDKTLSSVLNGNIDSISNKDDNGLLVFCPYSTMYYNIYDFPTAVNLIRVRNASFIPTSPKLVNKDVVIGYAHTSHASVRDLVMFYINKIVDIEMTIDINLFVHKMPRLVIVSPEDKNRVEEIMNDIEAGKKRIFLDASDYQAIKNVLESGAGGYIIDKLYAYKQALENELLTFLGIDNIGMEKKERLIVDEANSNNDFINDNSDCFLDTLQSFCKNVNEVLGYPLSVKAKTSPVVSESHTMSMNEDIEGEDQNEI